MSEILSNTSVDIEVADESGDLIQEFNHIHNMLGFVDKKDIAGFNAFRLNQCYSPVVIFLLLSTSFTSSLLIFTREKNGYYISIRVATVVLLLVHALQIIVHKRKGVSCCCAKLERFLPSSATSVSNLAAVLTAAGALLVFFGDVREAPGLEKIVMLRMLTIRLVTLPFFL